MQQAASFSWVHGCIVIDGTLNENFLTIICNKNVSEVHACVHQHTTCMDFNNSTTMPMHARNMLISSTHACADSVYQHILKGWGLGYYNNC